MNKISRAAATSAMVVSALGLAAGTSTAAPAAPAPVPAVPGISVTDLFPGLQYTSNALENAASINTPFGSFTTANGEFAIKDAQGTALVSAPLPEQFNTATTAIADATTNVVSTLVPNEAAASTVPGLHNVDATADFNSALAVAATQFGLATGVGAMAGGLIGLGVGCVGGALTGGFVALPTVALTPVGALLGCILGAGTGAGIGAVVGGAAVGIPVGIASIVQMQQTLSAPPAA